MVINNVFINKSTEKPFSPCALKWFLLQFLYTVCFPIYSFILFLSLLTCLPLWRVSISEGVCLCCFSFFKPYLGIASLQGFCDSGFKTCVSFCLLGSQYLYIPSVIFSNLFLTLVFTILINSQRVVWFLFLFSCL